MLQENTRVSTAATAGTVDFPAPAKCCHHWVIQAPNGPVSQGQCQKCHEVRHFQNFIEMSDWGDKKQPARPEVETLPAPEEIEFLGFYLEDFNPTVDLTAEDNADTG